MLESTLFCIFLTINFYLKLKTPPTIFLVQNYSSDRNRRGRSRFTGNFSPKPKIFRSVLHGDHQVEVSWVKFRFFPILVFIFGKNNRVQHDFTPLVHLLLKPHAYFYVCLIDGAAWIFPNFHVPTGNRTHVRSIFCRTLFQNSLPTDLFRGRCSYNMMMIKGLNTHLVQVRLE